MAANDGVTAEFASAAPGAPPADAGTIVGVTAPQAPASETIFATLPAAFLGSGRIYFATLIFDFPHVANGRTRDIVGRALLQVGGLHG